VVVARKLGAPWSPELAIGAVTSDGARYVNRRLISQLGVSDQYLEQITAAELREAERRERLVRAGAPAPSVTGRTVIVVDDGLATGATVRAACESLKRRQPSQLIVAAPVAAADTCAELRQVADAVVCPHELEDLGSVGYYYRRFEAVEDAEVQALLRSARVAGTGTPPR
jgi:predicted phosphoribosyltransferase